MSTRLKKGDGVGFVQIPNDILYDETLSLKAKGLYSYMLSKPDNWNFTSRSMASQLKEARRSILSAINELKDFGLLEYKRLRGGSGRYTIYTSVPKRHHGTKTTPSQNDTEPKRNRINNTYPISNTDCNNNPWDFRKKMVKSGHVGRLEKVYVEQVLENVYLDSEGKLYTDTRSTKQILKSTAYEIWKQLEEINEINKNANSERAMS